MSINEKKILAIVPARGGSKGIQRKNMQKVDGLSLIARTAQIASSLKWLDAAIISTDDQEMADEAVRYGLDFHFIRPAELASDTALGIDVWKHAWTAAEQIYGLRFDISILLEPTSPMRRADDILKTVNAVIDEGFSAATTVSPTPAHFSPHKTLTVSDRGHVEFYLHGGEKFSNRQTIPQYYYRNGICYAGTREHILERGMLIDKDAKAVVIDRPVVNIDEPFDLEIAEWLIKRS